MDSDFGTSPDNVWNNIPNVRRTIGWTHLAHGERFGAVIIVDGSRFARRARKLRCQRKNVPSVLLQYSLHTEKLRQIRFRNHVARAKASVEGQNGLTGLWSCFFIENEDVCFTDEITRPKLSTHDVILMLILISLELEAFNACLGRICVPAL